MVPLAWDQVIAQPHRTLILDEVPPDEVHLCAPTVCGYSFTAKKWGRLVADKFTPLTWHKDAFDHLVLAAEKKSLIESIVFADRSVPISDVISNKGGGFVVILHGKPGTGRTLTAEAAAERAEKPLMVVSAGELGGKPHEAEQSLRNIFDICKIWDAILLIDEAEVYLEARSLGNLERNGMVSAFLRVLEYHQQVVFLTTNHIDRLDPAFKSRVSVEIKFPNLDQVTQEEIWARFLKMAGVEICLNATKPQGKQAFTKDEITLLASRKLNGR
jgi:SpoVK/Ycf46/Vps4 family AAA+-type ATPase